MFELCDGTDQNENVDLEQLIYYVAEYGRDEDFYTLYKMLRGCEMYLPVDPTSVPSHAGGREQNKTTKQDQVKIRCVLGPENLRSVLACTKVSNSNLQGSLVGMKWADCLSMVIKSQQLEGLLLQGEKSWICFDRERIEFILDWYKTNL